jgi:uncharacterized membrane protein
VNSSSSFRTDFTSGLVVLLPLLVCLLAILWVYNQIASIPLLRQLVTRIPGVGSVVPVGITQVGLTVLATLVLLLTIGWLMRTAVGSVIETQLDALMNRVPVVRMVYNASKIAVETALADDFDLNRPVKIEAWNDICLTAFRTGKETADGRAVLFMPTAPNITSGFVIEVEESDIIDTDETIEEALTRVISAGFGEKNTATQPIEALDASNTEPANTPLEGGPDDESDHDQPAIAHSGEPEVIVDEDPGEAADEAEDEPSDREP